MSLVNVFVISAFVALTHQTVQKSKTQHNAHKNIHPSVICKRLSPLVRVTVGQHLVLISGLYYIIILLLYSRLK